MKIDSDWVGRFLTPWEKVAQAKEREEEVARLSIERPPAGTLGKSSLTLAEVETAKEE